MSVFIETQVADGVDDGYITSTSSFNAASSTVLIGKTAGAGVANSAFLRFMTGVVSGNPIGENTYLELLPANAHAEAGCNLRIYGEDADAPAAPTTAADYNGRDRTTAYVDWQPGGWTASELVQSPDLSDIINELTARAGFAGTVQLFIQDNSSDVGAYRDFFTYDNNPAKAALLHITLADPAFQINAGSEVYGVRADWQRVVKRVNTDGSIVYQPYALHTWDIAQMEISAFLELAAQQGQVLTSLTTTDIDQRNTAQTYTAAEIVSAVNTRQAGRRAVGVRVEFRVGVE